MSLDFYIVGHRPVKKGLEELYFRFMAVQSKDLMIRGHEFLAWRNPDTGLWSTSEQELFQYMDNDIAREYERLREESKDVAYTVAYMKYVETGSIDKWRRYVTSQARDSWQQLDQSIVFQNTPITKDIYATKRLPYALPDEPGPCPAYEEIMATLYSPEERAKLEWAIGSIISGDAQRIQKFIVLYGSAGAGKSTVLNIITDLFGGSEYYVTTFDAKSLGSANASFAMEPFKTEPLVAIQHDGDLSRIEDNTRLNSLVSHEPVPINSKYERLYITKIHAFLFMGTNKPVKITDAKSGVLRRLIDVRPSGRKIPFKKYNVLMAQTKFELGYIARHCLDVYQRMGEEYYNEYVPREMMAMTNDFYDFMSYCYDDFKRDDQATLSEVYKRYIQYAKDANIPFPMSRRMVGNELGNYFRTYSANTTKDGRHVRDLYTGFLYEKFGFETDFKEEPKKEEVVEEESYGWLRFNCTKSLLDKVLADCPAQQAGDSELPRKKWEDVTTKLRDIITSGVHYVKVPKNHIVIDFDLKNDKGEKDFILNWRAASQWPRTYAELSKSGAGIHLHYIYDGDPDKLSSIYKEGIEIKVFKGGSSLRRKLTKCNDIDVATLTSGLPLKKEKPMLDWERVKSEKQLRTMIQKNLEKKYHADTSSSINYIKHLLDEAYESGMHYDVSDMANRVFDFASRSTNQSNRCMSVCATMYFKSKDISQSVPTVESENEDHLVFFDCEVMPNLFVVCWKFLGGSVVYKMINPSPEEIETLCKRKLIGFNNRKYDNHILYARMMGRTIHELYLLSRKMIEEHDGYIREAYNLSYTDIYDFSSAANKKSLKKWEIELGIDHVELGLDWNKPVPENLWLKVAEYCSFDVLATEAVFEHLKGDWTARQILAKLSGLTVNDTTNQHSAHIIFGDNWEPQNEFIYTDLSTIFPGYKFYYNPEKGKYVSEYRGEDPGEGGYVCAEPGMWSNVALLDVASMHPSSIEALMLFGERYTKRFSDIKRARVLIKHHDFDKARSNDILDGRLADFLEDESIADDLATALKTVINSVYGLTSASFPNRFKDPRNKDNIVAKRGALFMINLKHEVQERGFTVAHIKTDSIKIPDATPEIIEFVMEYGKKYGYTFEHEATYERMCLVNNAVYIAKYASTEKCQRIYGYVPGDNAKAEKKGKPWTATGAQFAEPYVFKSLFSKEQIDISDLAQTKSVTSALYLDMNEELGDDAMLVKERDKLIKKYIKEHKDDFTAAEDALKLDRVVELQNEIDKMHDYQFVGRVGSFLPVKRGGGRLMRQNGSGWANATGTSGYRWKETKTVENLFEVDMGYYRELRDKAVDAMAEYGDVEWFLSDDISPDPTNDFMNIPQAA